VPVALRDDRLWPISRRTNPNAAQTNGVDTGAAGVLPEACGFRPNTASNPTTKAVTGFDDVDPPALDEEFGVAGGEVGDVSDLEIGTDVAGVPAEAAVEGRCPLSGPVQAETLGDTGCLVDRDTDEPAAEGAAPAAEGAAPAAEGAAPAPPGKPREPRWRGDDTAGGAPLPGGVVVLVGPPGAGDAALALFPFGNTGAVVALLDAPAADDPPEVELGPAEPLVSAKATTGVDAIAAPTPRTTASAPTRPTKRAQPIAAHGATATAARGITATAAGGTTGRAAREDIAETRDKRAELIRGPHIVCQAATCADASLDLSTTTPAKHE
jgi:hypothetical protein